MLNLPSPKSKSRAPRRGRGIAARKGGHVSGRGQKGQKSRSGYKAARPGYEGGRMPLSRRVPKLRGFSRGFFKSKDDLIVVSLSDLEKHFKAGEEVTFITLSERLPEARKTGNSVFKILANGEIKKKLTIESVEISETAKSKIEAAGGSVK